MAKLLYHLYQREMKVGPQKGKKLIMAQPVLTARISFDQLCAQLSDGSTVDAADVKAVLSRMATVISRNLELGMSVDCGELGLFRPSFGSKGVLTEAEFNASLISPARVVFTPRHAFRDSLRGVGFERTYTPEELRAAKPSGGAASAEGGTHSDDHAGV